ncbi:MAG: response regulator transcription factor [Armatimonadota bacterium]|nr:response regulator transcription factor [Armatimonadota bacterium]MDR7494686.1 response regulator transcription factor [Armatimonadota bacterium]MDR7500232.1 response regulator transcription factor [Armatimonadota bacterium]MDR7505612.1 response regulator transcription factor [Armatimonadota bacterium]MDR7548204.1 response regulator transcription factor [Armatimonadota bacterium]
MIRTALIDTLALVRTGVRTLLHSTGDISVVAEGATADEALHFATELRPDVLLMDHHVPGVLHALRTIRDHRLPCEVVILANLMHPTEAAQLIHAGASGYVCKDVPPRVLVDVLRSVCRKAEPRRSEAAPRPVPEIAALTRRGKPGIHGLTARELDIIAELANGATDQEIAERLHVGEGTVKTHIRHILHKLGVRNRTAAIAYALRTRVIE